MRKHYNLFYIFREDKEQSRMSSQKSLEIWEILEKRFYALLHSRLTLPEATKEEWKRKEK